MLLLAPPLTCRFISAGYGQTVLQPAWLHLLFHILLIIFSVPAGADQRPLLAATILKHQRDAAEDVSRGCASWWLHLDVRWVVFVPVLMLQLELKPRLCSSSLFPSFFKLSHHIYLTGKHELKYFSNGYSTSASAARSAALIFWFFLCFNNLSLALPLTCPQVPRCPLVHTPSLSASCKASLWPFRAPWPQAPPPHCTLHPHNRPRCCGFPPQCHCQVRKLPPPFCQSVH